MGLSGAGKTTLLKTISPNAYIMAESKRRITDLEARSWGLTPDTLINTSNVPNFAHVVFNKKFKLKGDYCNSNNVKDDSVILMIIDTLGQEIFFDINRSSIKGSSGIIFVLDSSVSIPLQKEKLISAYQNMKAHFDENAIVSVILNKQDLWERMATAMLPSYKGKDKELKEELDSVIPEFGKCKYYSTSALKNWGVKEAFENITKQIMKNLPMGPEIVTLDKK